MPLPGHSDARPRLAVRCDGGDETGAGHVGRCLPLTAAFTARGWSATFVGHYQGLARALLQRAAVRTEAPSVGGPCGLTPDRWDAAILDSYSLDAREICQLAERLPIVTLGEARRCETAGVLIDYHLDRMGQLPTPRLLPGPAYAPLDPAFAGSGRAREEVAAVLVTVGGSEQALSYVPCLSAAVEGAFPQAELVVPRNTEAGERPARLVDLVSRVDLAVAPAGVTAYELACAGVPQVAVAIVPNQRRVVDGIRRYALAPCVDLSRGEAFAGIGDALQTLRDRDLRRAQVELGRSIFDGHGAARAVEALLTRWITAPTGAASMHAPR